MSTIEPTSEILSNHNPGRGRQKLVASGETCPIAKIKQNLLFKNRRLNFDHSTHDIDLFLDCQTLGIQMVLLVHEPMKRFLQKMNKCLPDVFNAALKLSTVFLAEFFATL